MRTRMDPALDASPTRRAGACSAATTRRTTGPRAACPRDVRPAIARALRLRAHGRRDRRRAAPRRPPGARAAPRSTPGRPSSSAGWRDGRSRTRSSARSSTPAARHGLPLASCCSATCARCASTARPVRIATLGRSSTPTWTARPAPVGRIMAPLLGVPERHHAELGAPRRRPSSSTNFIRDVREDWALDRDLPAGLSDRDASASRGDRDRAAPALRALARTRSRRARALFARRRPRGRRARPASVRPGVRLAVARLRARARPRRAHRLRRARRARRRCAPGSCRGAALGALRR